MTSEQFIVTLDGLRGWIVWIPKAGFLTKEEAENLKYQLDTNQIKSARYDMLKDRYLNQNSKYFGELCGLYFEDESIIGVD